MSPEIEGGEDRRGRIGYVSPWLFGKVSATVWTRKVATTGEMDLLTEGEDDAVDGTLEHGHGGGDARNDERWMTGVVIRVLEAV